MKSKLLALALLAGSSAFGATHFSVGVNIGGYAPAPYYVTAPPPPPPAAYYAPSPGPGFVWVGGYYYPVGRRYEWRPGYWARPPYRGASWVAPRYRGGYYYGGYWRR